MSRETPRNMNCGICAGRVSFLEGAISLIDIEAARQSATRQVSSFNLRESRGRGWRLALYLHRAERGGQIQIANFELEASLGSNDPTSTPPSHVLSSDTPFGVPVSHLLGPCAFEPDQGPGLEGLAKKNLFNPLSAEGVLRVGMCLMWRYEAGAMDGVTHLPMAHIVATYSPPR